MEIVCTKDLLAYRIGDMYSNSCFLARQIPSLVALVQDEELSKLLNFYLDVVRDSVDLAERAMKVIEEPIVERDASLIPVMFDDLIDLADHIKDQSLIDYTVLFSSCEMGVLETRRVSGSMQLGCVLGNGQIVALLTDAEAAMQVVCDRFERMLNDKKTSHLLN